MHSLDSRFVERQLDLRTIPAGDARPSRRGDWVLYWMQATHRLDENWALRLATREADRLGLPVVVHQGLDPTYEHASDRLHHFVLAGARETAHRARELGIPYQFVLRRRRDDDRRVVDRLAARAALVVTDLLPTAGVVERTRRLAGRVNTPVLMVDGSCIVPSGAWAEEQYAAYTLRPKLRRLLEHALEPVEDRPPRSLASRSLVAALAGATGVEALDLDRLDLDAELAACEIDHAVPPAPVPPGRAAAVARLDHFVHGALAGYAERRRDPNDDGSSRLSPYLHFGQLGAAEAARAARAHAPPAAAEAFLDELVTWRELSFNFCLRNRHHRSLRALPRWAVETLAAHAGDERPALRTLRELEEGRTGEPLWDAAQQELRRTGMLHNAVRQLWGKSVLLWTRSYPQALRALVRLNDRWALDGRDPNSYGNILWCFGKFDRPFAERPVWGKVRPMSLARARAKFDVDEYVRRWSAEQALAAEAGAP